MKDTYSDIGVAVTLVPIAQTATLAGTAIDLRGFNAATLIVNTGAIASSGLYDIRLQESATTTSGDFTDVAAADLLGTLPAGLAADSVYKQGYVGTKRYIRALITKQSGASIVAGAVIVRGEPSDAPVA